MPLPDVDGCGMGGHCGCRVDGDGACLVLLGLLVVWKPDYSGAARQV